MSIPQGQFNDWPSEPRIFSFTESVQLKCSRTEPCTQCATATQQCEYRETDTKRRPATRGYVSSLENRIAGLESLVAKLKNATPAERDRILLDVSFVDHLEPRTGDAGKAGGRCDLSPFGAKRSCLHSGPEGSLVFHGPTSIYHLSTGNTDPRDEDAERVLDVADAVRQSHLLTVADHFGIDLDGELVANALLYFFRWQYPHLMFVYREAFLRDHFGEQLHARYWSGQLLLAICALGSQMMDGPDSRQVSERFFAAAESILLVSGLAQPCITNVQAFLCLAHYEIGRGHISKGWEYSGTRDSKSRAT